MSIESAAQATPIAAIGPMPEVPLTFAIVRQRRPAITVAAEANTAGPAERIAARHRLVAVEPVVQLLSVSARRSGARSPCPAPSTSTDMIELDCELIVTPISDRP